MTGTVVMNEEFLVNIRHQRILITSLPFVHTARRCYRLNDLVRCKECSSECELPQTAPFRGSKSRNKVSVGEPADGSLLLHKETIISFVYSYVMSTE